MHNSVIQNIVVAAILWLIRTDCGGYENILQHVVPIKMRALQILGERLYT